MRLIITGTPGVGKTTLARLLSKKLGCLAYNEKTLALEKKIGKWNEKENELVIPLEPFAKMLDAFLSKQKNAVIEGHLLCELKLKADYVILIRVHPELLESRLQERNYTEEKIQDNVFCEGIDYCKKHVERNYPKEKIVEIQSGKTIKETLDKIIKGLKEKGAKL